MDERSGAVVALKDLSEAKSRVTALGPAVRRRLAELMAITVVRALAEVVDELVVVTAAPGVPGLLSAYGLTVRCLPDPGHGLNRAYAAGAADLTSRGCDLVLACMADLPALTPAAVADAVAACTGRGRWFVPDTPGTGTTLLAARDCALSPAFGPDSAARHARSGACELAADPGLRRDVDNAEDLAEAARLGLQPPVSSLLDADGRVTHDTAVVAGPQFPGWSLISSGGTRAYASPDAVGAEVRALATGQRVHLVRDADGAVRHLWL